jgi:phosphomannomutase
MSTTPDALRTLVESWASDDPDPSTAAELEALLAAGSWDELADRFAGRLEFGTAGLRGVLGGGPNRMNLAVVRAATAGLCAYLERTTEHAQTRGLAIGFDGRRMSAEFARETARVALGRGFKVRLFDDVTPTPVLAFAVLDTGAAAGVMVTASHNPPEYNGFKVYWGNGAQIVPPHDVGIAAEIERCGALKTMPLRSVEDGHEHGLVERLGAEIEDRYHAAIQRLLVLPAPAPRDLCIVYTALHGVGGRHVLRALASAGFEDVHAVDAQHQPDGSFPTVRFPNPEEHGAMDLVLQLAREREADLVIANDPDADRLALAVRRGPSDYVQLTGNEVGCLLAHHVLEHTADIPRRTVLSSLVSSPMLGAIARAHGAHWEETLTGFKWIANRALELERQGHTFVFGYEEALGYTVGSLVRDKDGVSAALVAAELAAKCKARGRTLLDELELCARRYGLYLSRQVAVTMKGSDGAARIQRIMAGVRSHPPDAIGTHAVLAVQDLLVGERRVRSGTIEKLALPPSNVLALELDGGHRVMLRPSGTEPKIKYYFDFRETIAGDEAVASARGRAERVLDGLVRSFVDLVGALPQ